MKVHNIEYTTGAQFSWMEIRVGVVGAILRFEEEDSRCDAVHGRERAEVGLPLSRGELRAGGQGLRAARASKISRPLREARRFLRRVRRG